MLTTAVDASLCTQSRGLLELPALLSRRPMTSQPLHPSHDTVERPPAASISPWWHTAVLIAIILAFSFVQGRPSNVARAGRFSSRVPIYAASLAYEFFLFGYVWLGLRSRKVKVREITGGKWRSFADFLIDVAVAFLFTIVVYVALGICSFALHFSGTKAALPFLPQSWKEMAAFMVLSLAAGFCEEFVFRGYFQRQFLAWTRATWISIALQAIVFGAAHYYQGWRGVVTITIYGALFGILAWMRKSLRPGMIQHGCQDSFAGLAFFILTKYKLMPPLNLLLR